MIRVIGVIRGESLFVKLKRSRYRKRQNDQMVGTDPVTFMKTGLKNSEAFPYASELITDVDGRICKVVIDFSSYREMVEALEDINLLRAMENTKTEKSLTREQALAELAGK